MVLKKNLFQLLPLFFILLFSCNKNTPKSQGNESRNTTAIRTLRPSYAEGFNIEYFDTYKKITVFNPWQKDAVFATYYLSEHKSRVPNDGIYIQTPVNSIIATSCTFFEFLSLLNEIDKITGVCDPDRIYNPVILERYKNNIISSVGDPFQLNLEKILFLKPDIVMLSGFNQEDKNGIRLTEMGVSVVYNNEWMEKSALARAEWIKYIASFWNKEDVADSIFSEIETSYNNIRLKTENLTKKPLVLSGNSFKGTWYLPGGNSFMAKLYRDAGGDYSYKDNVSAGSIPLSFESILESFSNADIWMHAEVNSIEDLLKMEKRYMYLNAVKNGNVYNFNKRTTATGGNDYWETAIARPDLLLTDIISVFHPELNLNHTPIFINQLK